MSILTKIIGGGIGEMANGIAGAIDRFVETDEEKKAADILLMKVQQEPDSWQAEVNKIEANHRTIFVAGWRPFIGWICGVGILWKFILMPVTIMILQILNKPATIPNIETGELMTLIFALLGLGGIRTYEKKHNLTK